MTQQQVIIPTLQTPESTRTKNGIVRKFSNLIKMSPRGTPDKSPVSPRESTSPTPSPPATPPTVARVSELPPKPANTLSTEEYVSSNTPYSPRKVKPTRTFTRRQRSDIDETTMNTVSQQ